MKALTTFPTILSLASILGVAGCGSSGGTSPDNEAGGDGPTAEASSDAPPATTDAPSCSGDAAATSCCCAGDQQVAPACSTEGTLTCTAGYGLYHGADCSCTSGRGPCCGAQNTLDASDAPTGDGDVCAAPKVLRYESPGCGASAHPVCGFAGQDACSISVCGCDGTTLVKCDYASAPWAHVGPCGSGDASVDAADQ